LALYIHQMTLIGWIKFENLWDLIYQWIKAIVRSLFMGFALGLPCAVYDPLCRTIAREQSWCNALCRGVGCVHTMRHENWIYLSYVRLHDFFIIIQVWWHIIHIYLPKWWSKYFLITFQTNPDGALMYKIVIQNLCSKSMRCSNFQQT